MAKTLAELDAEFRAGQAAPSAGTSIDSEPVAPEKPIAKTPTLAELDELFRVQKKPEQQKAASSKTEEQQEWRTFLLQTACSMLVVYLLLTFVFGVTLIRGDSMQPSFHENDVALFWRLSGSYVQGDVVLFRSDASPDILIKRVAAGPGDVLEIDDDSGVVIVNDVILAEPYIFAGTYSKGGNSGPIVMGEDEYFVLGDNRSMALDSRYPSVGAIPRGEILGKIIFMVRSAGA